MTDVQPPLDALPTLRTPAFSFVLEQPAASPERAARFFAEKLALETDPADVCRDIARGARGFVVVDARPAVDHAARRVPDAISLPWRSITADSTAHLSREDVLVTYCWGNGCNASTKAAARLAALGFRVKEMVGGIDVWMKERNPTEGTLPPDAPVYP